MSSVRTNVTNRVREGATALVQDHKKTGAALKLLSAPIRHPWTTGITAVSTFIAWQTKGPNIPVVDGLVPDELAVAVPVSFAAARGKDTLDAACAYVRGKVTHGGTAE
jgi:hypothetical protein